MSPDDLSSLRSQVATQLLEETTDKHPDSEPIGFTSMPAWRVERACQVVSVGVRVTVAVAIVGGAVAGRGWWLVGFAIAALFSTQPQHRVEPLLVSETRPLVWPSRVPWLLCCALVLCLLRRPQEAAWFTIAWFVVRLSAHVGEYAVATGTSIIDSRFTGRLTTFIRPAAAFVVRSRTYDSFVTIGAGVVLGTATALLAPSANPTAAFGLGLLAAIVIENSSGRWQWTDAWLRVLGVVALTMLATRVHWWVLLAPITASLAMMLLRANHTLGYVPLTKPADARVKSAWVDLAKGRTRQVITNLEGEEAAHPDVMAALAVAHALDGHPGHARRLARHLADQHCGVRDLVEAQVHALLGTRPPELREAPDLTTSLGRATQLAWLRASIPHGSAMVIAEEIAGLIPSRITRDTVMWAADCYLALGETLLGIDQFTSGTAASRAFALADLFLTQDREFLDRSTLEARQLQQPAPHELGARGAAVTRLAFAGDQESPAMFLLDDDALLVLTELSSPFVVAAYCNRGADLHRNNRQHVTSESIQLRAQAFASLNVVRHELADPDDRACWWDAFLPTLDTLLEEVHGFQDWPLLLEIIEAARLQLGTSREDLRPTALRIAGQSILGSQRYYFGSRPTMVDLEDIIHAAGGKGAWWWSTHVSRKHLYWALTSEDQQGVVQGGRISMAAVNAVLQEFGPHLSLQGQGESDHDFFERMSRSALLAPPSDVESTLADRVGQLLPRTITDVRSHNRIRTTICMALAPELAHIPWAWTSIGGHRLVESFDTVIVPPASVLPTPDADDEYTCPIATCLVDPGGDLYAAEEASAHLPLQAARIDSQTEDPRASLTAALRAAPYDSTLFLACHTVKIANRRGFALAPLDNIDSSDVLFASDIARADTDYPMPRQVIALACESSDMTSALLGEWTVLGAALIQAGARRALVTAFPILDIPEVDRYMVAGVADGVPLHVLISSLQLSMLHRWRAGDSSAAPMAWAGLQLFGALPAADPTARVSFPAWAEENLLRGIDDAAEHALPGSPTVDVADLMTCFATYGHTDGLPRRVRAAVRRRFITKWPAPLHLMGYRNMLARLDHRPRVISDELLAIIVDARDLAREAGQCVYDIDHVFVAALRTDHPSCVAMRNLTGLDSRNPAVVERFLAGGRDNYHHTGEAVTPHLASGEAERVYHALGIAPPRGEDRWLHSDRVA
ncbi:CHAT domain-containing protein [Knoellia sp. S7-12]|uniref:CHAT domain-containing protein n=1 Tax=Knoellia sp. S7-12 TaxID=3126698 RepID=UPI0033671815